MRRWRLSTEASTVCSTDRHNADSLLMMPPLTSDNGFRRCSIAYSNITNLNTFIAQYSICNRNPINATPYVNCDFTNSTIPDHLATVYKGAPHLQSFHVPSSPQVCLEQQCGDAWISAIVEALLHRIPLPNGYPVSFIISLQLHKHHMAAVEK